jgi:GH43 family beta-xylosidase
MGGAATGGSGGASGNGATSGSGGASGSGGTGGMRTTFRNPLNTSHGSDPWMVYYDGYYYLAATTWGNTLTMKRGRTIQELKNASTSVIWQDSNAARCCNMWAPEFYLIDGPNGPRWYHYYTAGDGNDLGTQRSHVLESEGLDPRGPYTYRGQLLNYWAIDGSVLEVGSSRYFMFSAWDGPTQNVWIIAMGSPWTVTGNRTLLTAPVHAWEREGSDPVNEGPAALYHDGRIFVTYSASQCADPGYKLGLLELTGSNPLDAGAWWKSTTPVFQAANNAYGPAHNGFFTSPDGTENWLVYHATTNSNGSCWTDRTTRIQAFTWNANGLPNFGSPLALSTDILAPAGE